MLKRLSQQERLEQAFREDRFEFAETLYNLDEPAPTKKRTNLFDVTLGATTFGEILELGDDIGSEAMTRN